MSTSRRSSTARRSARLSSARIELGAGPVELAGQPADLPLDLVHDPLVDSRWRSRLVQLVADVVHLALQPLLLLLQPVALAPDLLEALRPALVPGRGCLGAGCLGQDAQANEEQADRRNGGTAEVHSSSDPAWSRPPPMPRLLPFRRAPAQTFRRCRPTLTRLPPRPSSTPNTTISSM